MSLELLMEATVSDYDDGPSHARITLSLQGIKRILHLSKVVKDNDACSIEVYDSPEWLTEDNDNYTEWDGRSDIPRLKVSNDTFHWTCYIKNTDVEIGTHIQCIPMLREYMKVKRMTKKDLPLLFDTLTYEESKRLFRKRLHG